MHDLPKEIPPTQASSYSKLSSPSRNVAILQQPRTAVGVSFRILAVTKQGNNSTQNHVSAIEVAQ